MTSRLKPWFFLSVLVVALAAAFSVWYATSLGIGLSEDSLIYLYSAESFLDGKGLSYELQTGQRNPLIIFPPGYPILIILAGWLGVPTIIAARWTGVIFMGLTAFLVALAVKRSTGSNKLSILASVFFITSADMLFIHSMAWSEAPFLFYFVLVILSLDIYFERGNRLLLLIASCAMGAAFITRYAGVILLATAGLVILFRNSEPFRRKIQDAMIFGFISCTPVLLWGIRNRSITGNMTDREVAFHLISARNILPALDTIRQWLVPHDAYKLGFYEYVLLALIMGSSILWIVLIRRAEKKQVLDSARQFPSRVPMFTGGFIVIYILFLIFWVSFFDADPQISFRYLAPVYICAVIYLLSFLGRISRQRQKTKLLHRASLILGFSIAFWFAGCSFFWVTKTHDRGMGYSRRIWSDSPILQSVMALPMDVRVYTNAVAPVRIYDPKRVALDIPKKKSRRTLKENESYLSEMQRVQQEIQDCHAVILWFDRRSYRDMTNEHDLMGELRIEIVHRENDGSVLGNPDCRILSK